MTTTTATTTKTTTARKLGLYATIKRETDKLGLPRHYRDDLTIHDKATARGIKPGEIAFWCVRECGTHLYILRSDGGLKWLQAIAHQHRKDGRFYIWRAGELWSVSAELWESEAKDLMRKMPRWRVEYQRTDRLSRHGIMFDVAVVQATDKKTAREIAESKNHKVDGFKVNDCIKIVE